MVDNKFSIDLNRVIRGIEDRDESIALELSDLALRFRREDLLPVLINASSFCKDIVFTTNLLHLLALFNQKYLLTITRYESNDNPNVSKLARELRQTITADQESANTHITELSTPKSPLMLLIEQKFSIDNQNHIEAEIEQFKLQSEDWTELYTKNFIELVVMHCYQSIGTLSIESNNHILKFLTNLKLENFKHTCVKLCHKFTDQRLEQFLKFIGDFDREYLSLVVIATLDDYSGSSTQQKWLSSMMSSLRGYPDIHLEFLNQCISMFEYDNTLIKEVSEASLWQGNDAVATLLTWMNRINNEDLKFRIVRSLDRLVTSKDIQLLRNTISISENDRDKRILTNILQVVESKSEVVKKPHHKKVSKHNSQQQLSNEQNGIRAYRNHIALTFISLASLVISGIIIFLGYKEPSIRFGETNVDEHSLIHFSESKSKLYEDLLQRGSSLEIFECRARVIRIQPLRILCDGISVDITNESSDFSNLNTIDMIKVKLMNWSLTDYEIFMTKAEMKLLNQESWNTKFPYTGPTIE